MELWMCFFIGLLIGAAGGYGVSVVLRAKTFAFRSDRGALFVFGAGTGRHGDDP